MKHTCVICGGDDSKGGAFVPSTGGFICIECLYSSNNRE